MKVDVDLLKKRINRSSLNVKKVASSIGIDESTFYRKLKANGETFTVKEMFAIIEVLDIEKTEAERIFFAQQLA